MNNGSAGANTIYNTSCNNNNNGSCIGGNGGNNSINSCSNNAPTANTTNNNNIIVLNNNNLHGSAEMCTNRGEQPDPDFIKMFVGQVPKSMDEDQLREMFEEFGRVHSINVLRDKVTGVSKGK